MVSRTGAIYAVLLTVCAIGVVAGCGDESKARREWTAADHAHPPQAQVDPERVPQQRSRQGAGASAPTLAQAARALWKLSCAGCHGVDGEGPSAPTGGVQARDLRDADWHEATTDDEIAKVIRAGRGAMPAFGNRLPEEAITALVMHVRSLRAAKDPAEQ